MRIIAFQRLIPTLLGAGLLAGCATADQPSVPPNVGVTMQDLTRYPSHYIGDQVTVSATVREVRSPGVFVIGASDRDEDAVLVVRGRDTEQFPSLEVGTPVQVHGSVRVMTENALAEEWGTIVDQPGLTLDPPFYAAWEQRPVIVAEWVRPLPPPSSLRR